MAKKMEHEPNGASMPSGKVEPTPMRGANGGPAGASLEHAGLTYEEALSVLEQTVARLESGSLPLEASLLAFDDGIGLIRMLTARLDAMEQRLLQLSAVEGSSPVPLEDL